jgi:hypothetical protein
MAVQFEFYKNPVQGEEEGETSYHPRVVNFQHVTTQRLAAEIHSATTFGKAEVEAMLMELSRCMGNHLREGYILTGSAIFRSHYKQQSRYIPWPHTLTK